MPKVFFLLSVWAADGSDENCFPAEYSLFHRKGLFKQLIFLKRIISIQYLKTWILFKLENDFALTFVQDSLELWKSDPLKG